MLEDTKKYEISLILGREEAYQGIISFIKEKVSKVLEENQLRRIRLAYPINKEETGFFTWVVVAAKPEIVNSLQKDLETNPSVLRVLIITPPIAAKAERKPPRLKEVKEKFPRETSRALPLKDEPGARIGEALTNELLEKKLEEILK